MPNLTKRTTNEVSIPEYDGPLLLAKPSGQLAMSLRTSKIDLYSEAGLALMLADMLVHPDGTRMLTPEAVPAFTGDISAESLLVIMNKCFEMHAPAKGVALGNSKPSTSAE